MSRVGNDDWDHESSMTTEMWENIYRRAREGKRGQAFLKELETSLLAMPEKKLISGAFCREGQVCALGSVAVKRKIDAGVPREEAIKWVEAELPENDENDSEDDILNASVRELKMTRSLAYEVMERNDRDLTDEERYSQVLEWTRENIKAAK
jgi:hypothetical protein